MSLWHVDMKTEGVNGKLLLLALPRDSSDIGAMLPREREAQRVLKQRWARFLGLRLRCPMAAGWKPSQSRVCLRHRNTHPERGDENIFSASWLYSYFHNSPSL